MIGQPSAHYPVIEKLGSSSVGVVDKVEGVVIQSHFKSEEA